jgi:hypothetical protein
MGERAVFTFSLEVELHDVEAVRHFNQIWESRSKASVWRLAVMFL